jgi:hypothetical protein
VWQKSACADLMYGLVALTFRSLNFFMPPSDEWRRRGS